MTRPKAKKKPGPPRRSERDDTAVKVDKRLAGMAKMIAVKKGISLAELLSGMLKAPIERAYSTMLREFEQERVERDQSS